MMANKTAPSSGKKSNTKLESSTVNVSLSQDGY
jgi:hypothetical protein